MYLVCVVKSQTGMKEKAVSDVLKYNGLYAWRVDRRQAT